MPEQTGVQAQGHVTAGRPRASEEAWPWAPGFPVPNLRDCDRDTQFAGLYCDSRRRSAHREQRVALSARDLLALDRVCF